MKIFRLHLGILLAALMLSGPIRAAEKIYSIMDEPNHKTVFLNDRVHVYDAHMKPGEKTFYHDHTADQIVVFMRTGTYTTQNIGEAEVVGTTAQGTISYYPYSVSGKLTHRVLASQGQEFWVFGINIPPANDRTAKGAVALPDQQRLEIPQGSVQRLTVAPKGAASVAGSFILTMSSGVLKAPNDPKAWAFEEGKLRWIEDAGEGAYINESASPVSLIVFSLKKK